MLHEKNTVKTGTVNHAVQLGFSADIEDAYRKAVEKGGRVQQEKTGIGEYGFIAKMLDTERNAIGLHSRT